MNKTYVLYIGVKNVRSNDIIDYVNNISKIVFPLNVPENTTIIKVPTDSTENRLECIDPIYITDIDLINKHNLLLNELNINIKKIINNEE